MESRSKVGTKSKAPIRAPRSPSKKWIARASVMAIAGTALTLEPALSLSGQARATTVWGHREHEFQMPTQTATISPVVIGKKQVPIQKESIESQLATPELHISRSVKGVDFEALMLDGCELSSLLDLGATPDQDQPLAASFVIESNKHVAVCGERTAGQQGPDKSEFNAHALAREVALTESQTVHLVPVLHQHSGLSGTAVVLESDIEEAAYGVDTIARVGLPLPLGVQVGAGTGPEMIDDSDATGRAGDFTFEGSATAGFETNPFLIDLPNTGTASLRVSLLPTFSRQGARGDVNISARIEHIEYTGSYDAVQNVGANFGSRFKLNERLEGNVDLLFDRGVFVTNLTGLEPVDGAPDVGGALPGGDDITLLGLDQPRTQYQAGAGLRYQHSERDELSVSMSFRADRFDGQDLQDLQDSDFLAGQISYARQIGSGLQIGVAVDARSIDFAEQSLGGITTISPQAIVGITFSPTWEFTGRLGVASIRSDTSFSEETSTAFSGDFSICRNGVRANLCLTGARQVVPFGIGGAGLQSNAGVEYSVRLSERETFSLNANYGKASEEFLAESRGIETIGGLLSYQLQLAERVRLSADARYTDLRLDFGPSISNFQVLVGLTVSLERAR